MLLWQRVNMMEGHFTSCQSKHDHYLPAHRVKGDVQLEETRLGIALDRNKGQS